MNEGTLLPYLPDAVALLCLARLPGSTFPLARCVCRAWKTAMESTLLHEIRCREGVSETWVFVCVSNTSWIRSQDSYGWYLIHPPSLRCLPMPPPPLPPCPSSCTDLRVMSAGSGRVLASGVDASNTLLVYCFDCVCRRWLPLHVPSLLENRRSLALASGVAEGDGYIYAAGGCVGASGLMKCAERLEVRSHTWSGWEKLRDMHVGRQNAAAVVLHDIPYVIGGFYGSSFPFHNVVHNSGEYWDPRCGDWVVVNELWPREIFGDAMSPVVAVVGGRLCALKDDSHEVMVFEFERREWASMGAFPAQGYYPELYNIDDPEWQYNFVMLEVGEELWIIEQGGVYAADPIVLACTPFTGKPLVWRVGPLCLNMSMLMSAITINI